MNLYTHAVLAKHLEALVQPADPVAYLWGALAPDIRYLAGLRREATHLPDDTIAGWLAVEECRFPGSDSFIQGYRAHCLLDLIDTVRLLANAFPLRLLGPLVRRRMRSVHAAVLIELHYHRAWPGGMALSGAHNPLLERLGVSAEQSAEFLGALREYLAQPSFTSAAAAFGRLGMLENTRLQSYTRAYHRLNASPLLPLLMAAVNNSRLETAAERAWQGRVA